MSAVEPGTSTVDFADARARALAGLVDYAGLFPPASLDMAGAVAGFRSARAGEHAFMLGRFVCPATRLEELAAALVPTMTADEAPWRLVVLLGTDATRPNALAHHDLRAAVDFSTVLGSAAPIDAVDIKLDSGADALTVAGLIAEASRLGSVGAFFEVPFGDGWLESVPALLHELAAARSSGHMALGAKVRCGGATQELFPSVEQVALFITTCRDEGLPFKATAGLHHPFRHVDRGTGLRHHGFVNVLTGAVLGAVHGLGAEAVAEILGDGDPGHFQISRRALRWRRLEAGPEALRTARASVFTGYGSCDFDDPTSDLVALGVLPLESAG